MANGKIYAFISLDQSKHHCYTLSTTCTLFKLASEVGPLLSAILSILWTSLNYLPPSCVAGMNETVTNLSV